MNRKDPRTPNMGPAAYIPKRPNPATKMISQAVATATPENSKPAAPSNFNRNLLIATVAASGVLALYYLYSRSTKKGKGQPSAPTEPPKATVTGKPTLETADNKVNDIPPAPQKPLPEDKPAIEEEPSAIHDEETNAFIVHSGQTFAKEAAKDTPPPTPQKPLPEDRKSTEDLGGGLSTRQCDDTDAIVVHSDNTFPPASSTIPTTTNTAGTTTVEPSMLQRVTNMFWGKPSSTTPAAAPSPQPAATNGKPSVSP